MNHLKKTAFAILCSYTSISSAASLEDVVHYENLDSGFFFQKKNDSKVFYFAKKSLQFSKLPENPRARSAIVDMTLETTNISFEEAEQAHPEWRNAQFVPMFLTTKTDCKIPSGIANINSSRETSEDVLGRSISGSSESFICSNRIWVKNGHQDTVISSLNEMLSNNQLFSKMFEIKLVKDTSESIFDWQILNDRIKDITDSTNIEYPKDTALFLAGLSFANTIDSQNLWEKLSSEEKSRFVDEALAKNFKEESGGKFKYKASGDQNIGSFELGSQEEIVINP